MKLNLLCNNIAIVMINRRQGFVVTLPTFIDDVYHTSAIMIACGRETGDDRSQSLTASTLRGSLGAALLANH